MWQETRRVVFPKSLSSGRYYYAVGVVVINRMQQLLLLPFAHTRVSLRPSPMIVFLRLSFHSLSSGGVEAFSNIED